MDEQGPERDPSFLVPTSLRIKRSNIVQQSHKSKSISLQSGSKGAESTNQAFDLFMKDMKDLGAL